MLDLAGMEAAVCKERQLEGHCINSSLFALRSVISALAEASASHTHTMRGLSFVFCVG